MVFANGMIAGYTPNGTLFEISFASCSETSIPSVLVEKRLRGFVEVQRGDLPSLSEYAAAREN